VPHYVASCAFSQCAPLVADFALVISVALPVQCVSMHEAVSRYDVFSGRACGFTYLALPVPSMVGFSVVSLLYCGWCSVVSVSVRRRGGGYLVFAVSVLLLASLLSPHTRATDLVLCTVVSCWAARVRPLESHRVCHCGRSCSLRM
jgi:hypothetical protein